MNIFPSLISPFLPPSLVAQMQAIALERNEMESLLFDMRSAPNKKHGELLDKWVVYVVVSIGILRLYEVLPLQ